MPADVQRGEARSGARRQLLGERGKSVARKDLPHCRQMRKDNASGLRSTNSRAINCRRCGFMRGHK